MNRAVLERDLRERAFGPSAGPERIGAEVELLVLDAEARTPVPLCGPDRPASLPLLRRFAARQGWREEITSSGVPRFMLPGGGILSFEPGGQIEFSTPAFTSASELLAFLRGAVLPLRWWMAEQGVELLSVGVDPLNSLGATALQLRTPRYSRMDAYLGALGPAGPRMMRQTASFQVNLDCGPEPLLRWRVLNALAPYLIAIFANSPAYAGAATGHRSFRAHTWRELDSRRTGIHGGSEDAVAEYLRFALDAPALLSPGFPPFGERQSESALEEWRAHLSTLFPEVRPKGYLEVRSVDAVAPEWYPAPLAFLAGIALDAPSLAAADELLGAPDPALLVRAGQEGLAAPDVHRVACELWDLALAGCAALGEHFLAGADLDIAREFAETHTRRGLAPADLPTLCMGKVS